MTEFISFPLVPIDVKTSHAFTLNAFFANLCRCQGNGTKACPKELREIATKLKEKSRSRSPPFSGFFFFFLPFFFLLFFSPPVSHSLSSSLASAVKRGCLTRKLNFDPFIRGQVEKGTGNKGPGPPLLAPTFISANRSNYFLPD